MDLGKVLQQLHQELANLDAAISSLERLQETSKNRGRDADWPTSVLPPTRAVRKRKARKSGAGGQGREYGTGEPGAVGG